MIEIRRIELSDEPAFRDFQALLLAEKEAGNNFIETRKVEDFPAFVAKQHKHERETGNPDWSTVSTYYAFENGEILGKISCRWEIEKGDLLRAGGHIGYVTSPKHRRKGVMSQLLSFALDEYQKRGIDRVLITTNVDNVPSRKTIEKFGGQLENMLTLEEDYPSPSMAGATICRYWVATSVKTFTVSYLDNWELECVSYEKGYSNLFFSHRLFITTREYSQLIEGRLLRLYDCSEEEFDQMIKEIKTTGHLKLENYYSEDALKHD